MKKAAMLLSCWMVSPVIAQNAGNDWTFVVPLDSAALESLGKGQSLYCEIPENLRGKVIRIFVRPVVETEPAAASDPRTTEPPPTDSALDSQVARPPQADRETANSNIPDAYRDLSASPFPEQNQLANSAAQTKPAVSFGEEQNAARKPFSGRPDQQLLPVTPKENTALGGSRHQSVPAPQTHAESPQDSDRFPGGFQPLLQPPVGSSPPQAPPSQFLPPDDGTPGGVPQYPRSTATVPSIPASANHQAAGDALTNQAAKAGTPELDDSGVSGMTALRRLASPIGNHLLPDQSSEIAPSGYSRRVELDDDASRSGGKQGLALESEPGGKASTLVGAAPPETGGLPMLVWLALFCSIGLNVYLGWMSRGFYARYQQLADEMRGSRTTRS